MGDFSLLLLFKMSIYRTYHFFSFLKCKAAAIIPNSQGYSKDDMRVCIKQAEPKSCGHWTVCQAYPPAQQLVAHLPIKSRIKVTITCELLKPQTLKLTDLKSNAAII